MAPPTVGPVLRAWYRWKSLRLPWRTRFLVGVDLEGATYWQFRISGTPDPALLPQQGRWRRTVHYPRSTPLSDIRVPPAWHQWLRYQRDEPPSIQEQQQERMRQASIKLLAREADRKWEAKERLVDMPGQSKGQPLPSLDTDHTERQGGAAPDGTVQKQNTATAKQPVEDPWKQASRPSETWQPEAWVPPAAKKG